MREFIRVIALVTLVGVAIYSVTQIPLNKSALAGGLDDSTHQVVGGPRCPPSC
jgi:hypothetical protein